MTKDEDEGSAAAKAVEDRLGKKACHEPQPQLASLHLPENITEIFEQSKQGNGSGRASAGDAASREHPVLRCVFNELDLLIWELFMWINRIATARGDLESNRKPRRQKKRAVFQQKL